MEVLINKENIVTVKIKRSFFIRLPKNILP